MLGQYLAMLRKDLLQELRTFDLLSSMGLYAVLVLVVYGVALAQAGASFDVLAASGGLVWILVLLTSLLGLNRSFSHETQSDALSALLVAPIDRGAMYLAKATTNLLALCIVEVVAVPLYVVLFLGDAAAGVQWGHFAAMLVVGTVGIAGVGTLLAAITFNTRGRDVLLAVLFIPLLFPLLWACVGGCTCLLTVAEAWQSTLTTCFALGIGYDVIMLLLSWLLFGYAVGE